MQFSLNHMVAPRMGYAAFFDLALSLGVKAVEIRNDIETSLMGNKNAKLIGKLAKDKGITILNVNALQCFNQWNGAKATEAAKLAEYAALVGAKALVLCPTNDRSFKPSDEKRLEGLRESLAGLAPILKHFSLTGCVEPLGFAECSLRFKSEAVDAIDAVKQSSRFKVTHDTFHYFVSGEKELFADRTALIHVSGVTDTRHSTATMRDEQRVLVDENDLIDNRGQVQKLMAAGYKSYVSFEPFAPEVHKSRHISRDLARSMDFLQT